MSASDVKRRGVASPDPVRRESETTRLLDDADEIGESSQRIASRSATWNGSDDFNGLPWWRTPSVYWLLVPYAIFTLAFGGILVPKINLIIGLVCQRYFADQAVIDPKHLFAPVHPGADNPQCLIHQVQSKVATFLLVMSLCTGLLSAIVAPRMGHLSDRYGRLRLLALSSCGGLVAETITILAAKFPDSVDYRWLILGSVFDGLTGSLTTGSMLSLSYTADCTPPSKRAVSIGYIQACLFFGLAFGPLLAGYFVEYTGNLLSIFYVAMGCHVCFILFVGFVVPESVSKQKKKAAQEKWEKEREMRSQQSGTTVSTLQTINPFEPLKILWPTGPGTSAVLRRNLVALATSDVILMGSSQAVGATLILYAEGSFGWGTLQSSRFISVLSLIRVVVLTGILPAINYFGRVRPAARLRRQQGDSAVAAVDKNSGADRLDIWVLRVAFLSDLLGSVGYIFVRTEHLFIGSGMMTALGGLGIATTQSVITKHVPADRVGQLLGGIGMMHAMTRVVGPLIFNGIYALTVESFPQTIFVMLAAFFVFGMFVTLMIKPFVHWEDESHEEEHNGEQRARDEQRPPYNLDADEVLI